MDQIEKVSHSLSPISRSQRGNFAGNEDNDALENNNSITNGSILLETPSKRNSYEDRLRLGSALRNLGVGLNAPSVYSDAWVLGT